VGRSFQYPGAPISMTGSPFAAPTRAPLVGEHTEEVLGLLDPEHR